MVPERTSSASSIHMVNNSCSSDGSGQELEYGIGNEHVAVTSEVSSEGQCMGTTTTVTSVGGMMQQFTTAVANARALFAQSLPPMPHYSGEGSQSH